MKIKLEEKILNFKGEPVRNIDGDALKRSLKAAQEALYELTEDENLTGEFINSFVNKIEADDLTLGEIIRNLTGGQKQEKEKKDETIKIASIGLKCVADKGTVDLPHTEREKLINLLEESSYSRTIFIRVYNLLSGDDPEEEEETESKSTKKTK